MPINEKKTEKNFVKDLLENYSFFTMKSEKTNELLMVKYDYDSPHDWESHRGYMPFKLVAKSTTEEDLKKNFIKNYIPEMAENIHTKIVSEFTISYKEYIPQLSIKDIEKIIENSMPNLDNISNIDINKQRHLLPSYPKIEDTDQNFLNLLSDKQIKELKLSNFSKEEINKIENERQRQKQNEKLEENISNIQTLAVRFYNKETEKQSLTNIGEKLYDKKELREIFKDMIKTVVPKENYNDKPIQINTQIYDNIMNLGTKICEKSNFNCIKNKVSPLNYNNILQHFKQKDAYGNYNKKISDNIILSASNLEDFLNTQIKNDSKKIITIINQTFNKTTTNTDSKYLEKENTIDTGR